MDIHTYYVHQAMSDNAPELKNYLDTRQTSNFTRKDYAGEPHDERHEEYNKRGLNMQRVKTVHDFKQLWCFFYGNVWVMAPVFILWGNSYIRLSLNEMSGG